MLRNDLVWVGEDLPEHISQALQHSLLGFHFILFLISIFLLLLSRFILSPISLISFRWVPGHLSIQRMWGLVTSCGHRLSPGSWAFFRVFFHLEGQTNKQTNKQIKNTVNHRNKTKESKMDVRILFPQFSTVSSCHCMGGTAVYFCMDLKWTLWCDDCYARVLLWELAGPPHSTDL